MDGRRTALITGASAGIGKAFAEQLAKDGFDLVITARRKDRLDALAEDIRRDRGVKVLVIAEDLCDPRAPERIVTELRERNVDIDVLVNNAGFGLARMYVDSTWQQQADMIQVLVTQVAHLTHALLPGMLERRYGRILHVASLAGLIPGAPSSTLYAGCKAFLVKFAESLAAEVQGSGAHVTAVCPGFTYSEFHDVKGTREIVRRLPSAMWQPADVVARDGIDAAMRGEVVFVPGPVNRLIAILLRHLPQTAARGIVRGRAKDFRRVQGA